MKSKLHLFAAALFVAALFYNFYLWGGLGRTPELGLLVTQGAEREVSLAGIYVPVGRMLVESTGLQRSASDFASERFASLQSRLLANPAAAMDTLLSNLPFTTKLSYYGAPLLLLLTAYLWWRRPREVHVGRRRG